MQEKHKVNFYGESPDLPLTLDDRSRLTIERFIDDPDPCRIFVEIPKFNDYYLSEKYQDGATICVMPSDCKEEKKDGVYTNIDGKYEFQTSINKQINKDFDWVAAPCSRIEPLNPKRSREIIEEKKDNIVKRRN